MNLQFKAAHSIGSNPWTILVSNLATIVSFLFLVWQELFQKQQSAISVFIFILSLVVFVIISVYSLKVRDHNKKLQDIANSFREINSIYRDRLFSSFFGTQPRPTREALIDSEKATLQSVCQRISMIYSTLIGKECIASIKLLTKENNSPAYATTYARSQNDCERDRAKPTTFEVGTGQNTAFDQALMPDTTGSIPHFFSGDLKKHKSYHNQRQDWNRYYRSAIVVPIRCPGVDGKPHRDDIGFLCIDTKSRNRLNPSHHVVMLAALADQMYNFMSLMRGKYVTNTEGEQ